MTVRSSGSTASAWASRWNRLGICRGYALIAPANIKKACDANSRRNFNSRYWTPNQNFLIPCPASSPSVARLLVIAAAFHIFPLVIDSLFQVLDRLLLLLDGLLLLILFLHCRKARDILAQFRHIALVVTAFQLLGLVLQFEDGCTMQVARSALESPVVFRILFVFWIPVVAVMAGIFGLLQSSIMEPALRSQLPPHRSSYPRRQAH